MRKTLKKRIKAGVVSRINTERRLKQIKKTVTGLNVAPDIADKIYKTYTTSKFITTLKARRLKTKIGNFYNNLIRLAIVLRRLNPNPNTITSIKNDILRTIPLDTTVDELLHLPTIYPQIVLLRNMLSDENKFPPQTSEDVRNLIALLNLIVDAMREPIEQIVINVPLLNSQNAFHIGQGKKKSHGIKRRK